MPAQELGRRIPFAFLQDVMDRCPHLLQAALSQLLT